MSREIDISDPIYQDFLEDANEALENLERSLVIIEEEGGTPDPDMINEIFRSVHTIKGNAGFVGLTNILNLSHALENVLGAIRNNELSFSHEVADQMFDGLDSLKTMVADLGASFDLDVTSQIKALEQILNPHGEDDSSSESAVAEEQVELAEEIPEAVEETVLVEREQELEVKPEECQEPEVVLETEPTLEPTTDELNLEALSYWQDFVEAYPSIKEEQKEAFSNVFKAKFQLTMDEIKTYLISYESEEQILALLLLEEQEGDQSPYILVCCNSDCPQVRLQAYQSLNKLYPDSFSLFCAQGLYDEDEKVKNYILGKLNHQLSPEAIFMIRNELQKDEGDSLRATIEKSECEELHSTFLD